MDASSLKAVLGGLVAIGVVIIAVYMFSDFGTFYEEAVAPKQPQVEAESKARCLERTAQRREYLKSQRDDFEEKQRMLERGEAETQNEAHRDYLEKYYAEQIKQLDDQYEIAIHETCE